MIRGSEPVAASTTRGSRAKFSILGSTGGWPALILALAAVPRLGWLDLVEFKADESATLTVAAGIAHGRVLPLVGIVSSLGLPNAPFFVYLMALPELFSRDPRLATAFVGALDVGSVLATYIFVARYVDRVAAVSAALLFAVSPWGIIYSRKVWEQDALPFFVTLAFFALFEALTRGRRFWILPGLALLTLAIQLHPTGLFLVLPAGLLVFGCLVGDRPFGSASVKWLVLGLAAGAVLTAPYAAWQVLHGWPLREVLAHQAGDAATFDLTALRLAASVATGNGYPTLAQVGDLWSPASIVELALLLGGIVLILRCVLTDRPGDRRFGALALLVWLAAPVMFQVRHSVPLYPHYFIILYPASFVGMGLAVSALASMRNRRFVPGRPVAALVVLIPTALGLVAFGQYVDALTQGALQDTYGVPLGAQQAWIGAATGLVDGGPIYFGSHDDLAASLGYLTADRWRVFDDRRGLPLPAVDGPSLLVLADGSSVARELADRVFAPAIPETRPLVGGPNLLTYRVESGFAVGASDYRLLDAAFDNGMALTGYRVVADASRRQIRIDLRWRFDGPVSAISPKVFTHLLDSRGEKVGQIDDGAYVEMDWRPGEECFDEFTLAWPASPGPFTVRVGLYDFASTQRFHLRQPASGAPNDALDLGLVDVKS
jgi:Dolichyl-phosphate-mannose-protein mannosyltransferase